MKKSPSTDLKRFLFADLDDSLFQSLEKCPSNIDLHPAAFLKDGSPISYTTARQRAFLAMAQEGMTIIPATARNRDAFIRVAMPFDSYAVLDYGGVILKPDGTVDEDWLDIMRMDMEKALPVLQRVIHLLDDYTQSTGYGGRARLIEDFSVPFYVVIKDPEKIPHRLERIENEVLTPWLATEGKDYFIHRNGNNLSILPNTLNKARAVAYLNNVLVAEHGDILTFAIGDSKSDARFMTECDYAIIPRGTQLAGLTLETL